MAIYKRGRQYWYRFNFNGRRIQRPAKTTNPHVARQIEAAFRTQLAKAEVGLRDRKPCPTLRVFSERFLAHMRVHCAQKPRTLEFWNHAMQRVLRFEPLASAFLDRIDEALIAAFVQKSVEKVQPASVNRSLAALRRALRLAQEWKEVDRIPKIHMLREGDPRDFVFSDQQRENYLATAPEPLRSVMLFLLETGLRLGEALALTWEVVQFEPIGDANRGYISITEGKSRNAKRKVPLTEDAQSVLLQQKTLSLSEYVFVRADRVSQVSRFRLSAQHARVRTLLHLPADCVIHSARHTMLTNLGASGTDVFSIKRIAGHSSVTISERYVHPTPEAMERAIDRLESYRHRAQSRKCPQGDEVATILATGERRSTRLAS